MYDETVVVWLETARMNRLAATAAFVELLRHQLNHMIDGGFPLGPWYFIANFVMSPVVRMDIGAKWETRRQKSVQADRDERPWLSVVKEERVSWWHSSANPATSESHVNLEASGWYGVEGRRMVTCTI